MAEKITKHENLALEIKNIWKLNNVSIHPLRHLSRRSKSTRAVTKNFLEYLENISLTKNILSIGQKAIPLQMRHIVQKFLGHAP